MQSVSLADVIDTADIRMRDLTRNANFVLKASQSRSVESDGLGQEFECNDLLELAIKKGT